MLKKFINLVQELKDSVIYGFQEYAEAMQEIWDPGASETVTDDMAAQMLGVPPSSIDFLIETKMLRLNLHDEIIRHSVLEVYSKMYKKAYLGQ